jgi:hypothetical protein
VLDETPGVCGGQSINPSPPVVSYASTLNQLFNASSPDRGVILSLNIPVRNRVSQATQVRSELESHHAGIRIGDAVQGEMNKMPSIPNVSEHPANRLPTDTGKSDGHLPLQ